MSQQDETPPPPPRALSVNINTIEKWLKTNINDAVSQTLQEFKDRQKNLTPGDSSLEVDLNEEVATFITNNEIGEPAYDGGRGRRRKSASSSSRPRRRSSKKRGTQRKQKRRQRRGSRRA
jgi:hypothetical protein